MRMMDGQTHQSITINKNFPIFVVTIKLRHLERKSLHAKIQKVQQHGKIKYKLKIMS